MSGWIEGIPHEGITSTVKGSGQYFILRYVSVQMNSVKHDLPLLVMFSTVEHYHTAHGPTHFINKYAFFKVFLYSIQHP